LAFQLWSSYYFEAQCLWLMGWLRSRFPCKSSPDETCGTSKHTDKQNYECLNRDCGLSVQSGLINFSTAENFVGRDFNSSLRAFLTRAEIA